MDLPLDVEDSEPEQEVEELKGKMLRENLEKVEISAVDELMQLKQNMPKALGSAPVELLQRWEFRAWRFMKAYRHGLEAREAQKRVKEYSTCQYKSHSDQIAEEMDVADA